MASSLFQRPQPASGASPSVLLDVLRGVAILAVFVQHLGDRFMGAWERAAEGLLPAALAPWVLTVLHHAYWGVDLFFVLSGLTLARGYANRYERGGDLHARDFFQRRAARILPAFVVALAVMLVTHPRLLEEPRLPLSLGLHALLLQGYAPEGVPILIGAAWSLTTESQFYLALPLLAPLLLRPARPALRVVLWALGLLVFAWLTRAALHALYVPPGVRGFAFELTQRRLVTSRIDQFVMGIFVVRLGLDRLRLRRPWLAVGLSAAAVVVAFRLEGAYHLEPVGALPYALVGLTTTALVCSVLALPEGVSRGPIARGLAALGVVSYGVFLYHQLALGVVGALLPGEPRVGLSLGVGLGALAASFALGLLSFRYVERPFLAARRPSS